MKPRTLSVLCTAITLWGCGVYTFTQSSLPGYFKTVDIPLFLNQSERPDVAEVITSQVTSAITGGASRLRLVRHRGDASVQGIVLSYESEEYQYEVMREREADVGEFIVRIAVTVEFLDNHKNEPLYAGTITGVGTWKRDEREEDGRDRAIADVVEQILNNSIQGW